MIRPSAFLDADVIFAGAASPHQYGASHVLLRLGQYTLLDCVTSEQAVVEVERNLSAKLPAKLATFRALVSECLRVVPNPSVDHLDPYQGMADPDDLPILVAAVTEGCPRLVTFNTRHFRPPPSLILIQRPGEFLAAVRALLVQLGDNKP